MAKRPTPKKRRAKSKGNAQHAEYVRKQTTRLKERSKSPYAKVAEPKNAERKALKTVTRIQA